MSLPISRRLLFLATSLAAPALITTRSARASTEVDVELVLAVDVSRYVDAEEMEMQMRGYAAAFRDPRLAEGIELQVSAVTNARVFGRHEDVRKSDSSIIARYFKSAT